MSVKFSVIVPLYCLNGDLQELEDGLRALTRQSIGSDSIEVILTGSDEDISAAGTALTGYGFAKTGSAADINIAKAFCAAFEAMSGELMIVYDPRNRWTDTAFSEIYDYFHNAPEWFDVLACRPFPNPDYPVRAFPFMYNRGTRVSNVFLETTCLHRDLNTTVLKCSAVKNSGYDGTIDYNIDSYLITLILSKYPKYGVLKQAMVTLKVINHDGYKCIYEDEKARAEAVIKYHNALLELKTDYNSRYLFCLIMYDLRSYVVDRDYICHYSQEIKKVFRSHIAEVFEALSDYSINDVPQLTTIQRWGLYRMKRWTAESDEKVILQYDLLKNNEPFHYRSGAVFNIQQMELKDSKLILDGMSPAFLTGESVQLFAKTQDGKKYDPESSPFTRLDIYNCFDEKISEGRRLLFRIPVNKRVDIRFYLRINGVDKPIKLNFGPDPGLRNNWNNTCVYTDDYIISCQGRKVISVREKSLARTLMNERNITRERKSKNDRKGLEARKTAFRQEKLFHAGRVKKRVAFATARSNTELMDNMKSVWDCCKDEKVLFTRRMPYSDQDLEEAANTVYRSKVIITDDYFFPLRRYGKRKDQYVIQIWHAPGAFKRFGINASTMFPGTDMKYHRDYDLVVTSSEYVRQIYADAFGIDVENVRALGMPRTDIWFDDKYLEERRNHVYEKYPEIKDKQVILYAPSFREPPGRSRVYLPEIDFGQINDGLGDDQIMILCPHPVMPEYEGKWDYDKIRMVRDVSTSDFMLAADLLVTDYSSVIFEYSLLDKPMAFLCYDYDEYDRDFYLDYETELPGDIFRDTDTFIEYLKAGRFECSPKLAGFRERYMSACDGNSSKRVAEAITEFLNR